MFAGQEKSSIDKYAGISSLNSGIFFCSKPKIIDKFVFTLPIDFTWKYLMDMKKAILTAMAKHFCWSRDFFGSNFGKNLNEIVNYSVNRFFLGVFRWHQTRQFWQLFGNDFEEKRSFIGSKQKLIEKLYFFQRKLSFGKSCPRQGESSFEAPSDVISAAVQLFLLKIAKNWTKVNTYHEKVFQLKVSWKKKGSFENVAEINLLSSNSPPLKNRKWWKACRFSAIWFLFEVLPGQEKSGFMKKCYSTVFFCWKR